MRPSLNLLLCGLRQAKHIGDLGAKGPENLAAGHRDAETTERHGSSKGSD